MAPRSPWASSRRRPGLAVLALAAVAVAASHLLSWSLAFAQHLPAFRQAHTQRQAMRSGSGEECDAARYQKMRHATAAQVNRANQLNPQHLAYRRSSEVATGRAGHSEDDWQPRSPSLQLWLHNKRAMQVQGKVEDLKASLRQTSSPSETLVAALERMWPSASGLGIETIDDLAGEWELHSAETRSRGDLMRIIFDMYQSGKWLNMEFTETPKVRIDHDGNTETRLPLRWGSRRDGVTLAGKLVVTGSNRFQIQEKSVTSSTLKLTVPSLRRLRELRVTYYDGEVLIIRDSHGMTDVLWRQSGAIGALPSSGAETAAHPTASQVGADDEGERPPSEEEAEAEGAVTRLGGQMEALLGRVEGLKSSLEALRTQASGDRSERQRLLAEIAQLERSVAAADMESKAHDMKLAVMDTLKSQLSANAAQQQKKSDEKERAHRELVAEVAELRGQVAEFEQRLTKHQASEESLHNQIKLLEVQLRNGPRDLRSGCRAALEEAHSELANVRRELGSTKDAIASMRRSLERKDAQLRRTTDEAEAEAAAHRRLGEKLLDREEEIAKQQAQLSESISAQASLRSQLAAAREALQRLEAREADGQQQAAEVEVQIGEIIDQAKEVQKLGKSLREKPKRFWPFR